MNLDDIKKVKEEGYEYSISFEENDVCKINVKVYDSYLDKVVEEKIKNYASSKTMKGFRSENLEALSSILKASIGKQAKKSSEEDVINEIIKKILINENLTIIQNKDFKNNESSNGLEFSLSFYIMPKFIREFNDFSEITIEDYEIDEDTSLEEYLDYKTKNSLTYEDILSKDYKIKEGDIVTFKINSTIDGKIFRKCCSDNYSHQITSNNLDNLSVNAMGLSIGEEKTFEFTPSPESIKPKLRGKKVTMSISAQSIKASKAHSSKEDFIKSIDSDNDKAMEKIKQNMKKEIDFYLSNLKKLNVINAIGDIGEKEYINQEIINSKLPNGYENNSNAEKEKILKETKRFAIASLFNIEFGKRFNVHISPQEVEYFIKYRISISGEDPILEAKKYQDNKDLVYNIRDSMYEGRVIGLIFNQMKKNISKISFNDLLKIHNNVTS